MTATSLGQDTLPDLLEKFSSGLVMTETDDLAGLTELHTIMEQVAEYAPKPEANFINDLALKTADLLQQLILAEVSDPELAYANISHATSAMMSVIRDGRSPEEINLTEISAGTDKPMTAVNAEITPISNPSAVDHDLLADFLAEAMEHIAESENNLLILEAQPDNMEAINAIFRTFHTIKGVSMFMGFQEMGAMTHEIETLLDKARRNEITFTKNIFDISFACVDALKHMHTGLAAFLQHGTLPSPVPELNDLLECIRNAAEDSPMPPTHQASSTAKNLSEALPATDILADIPTPKTPSEARNADKTINTKSNCNRTQSIKLKESVRVDADKLNRLVDTIGELVIGQSMLGQSIYSMNGHAHKLRSQVARLDKITRELQEIGMTMRMVPIRATFQKMARLVRDIADKTGKAVHFSMSGEDTELDKSVVDRIGDPLVHMVRNAVDHGIEASSQERVAAGKPECGQIRLSAFHKGGNIHIELKDDGRGLNRQTIINKAMERGLIENSRELTDREAFNLIFEPGFSTASQITDISGRGVGMDVVKRNIEALRGQIEIKSQPGKGSVFSMRLPLTLAIIEGMIVRVGNARYIIPTLNVIRALRPDRNELITVVGNTEMLCLKDGMIPLVRVHRLLEVHDACEEPECAMIVLVEDDGKPYGLMVDELIGKQQTVIKSLGGLLRNTPAMAGGAIMPDGRVGLILDISGLLRLAASNDTIN